MRSSPFFTVDMCSVLTFNFGHQIRMVKKNWMSLVFKMSILILLRLIVAHRSRSNYVEFTVFKNGFKITL